ncbi:MAG TPA: hypothetical protein ENJ37_03840 [Deltaproteobacteria bacterium]|nr:hypothetical protein [Deltaproteobacteria bacterium]
MAIEWRRVRDEYEREGLGFETLAGRHGCKAETVRRRARKEGWTRRVAPGGAPPSNEDILEEYRRLWRDVKSTLVRALKRSDAKHRLDELKAAKLAGEIVATIVKGESRLWGLDENLYKELLSESDEIAAQMEGLTVSQGAAQALDGE